MAKGKGATASKARTVQKEQAHETYSEETVDESEVGGHDAGDNGSDKSEGNESDNNSESEHESASVDENESEAEDESDENGSSSSEEHSESEKPQSAETQKISSEDKKKAITEPEAKDSGLDEGGRTVYVNGLPFDFKRKDLQELFEKQGAMVTYIHMPVFEDSKRSRGFAQVTFTKREYVDLACELNGIKLKGGRWLQVQRLDKSKIKKKSGKQAKGKDATKEDSSATGGDAKVSGATDRKRRYTERPDGCHKVYVGNIPMDAKESEVRDLFQRFGKIKSMSLGTDKKTGKFRGFGFVEFESNPEDEPAEKAFSLSGKVRIHAKKLVIDYAPDTVVCYKCKSKNHYRGECPVVAQEGKKLKLDTDE